MKKPFAAPNYRVRPANAPDARRQVLDLEKLNLGTSQIIASPGGSTPQPGKTSKLLDVVGDDQLARDVTIVMGQTFLQPDFPPGTLVTQPVTGIIEWGNGAAFARIEFDIPSMSRLPYLATSTRPQQNTEAEDLLIAPFRSPFQSGVSISVTASAVRVFARNDNNNPNILDPSSIIGINPSVAGTVEPTVFAHISYGKTFGGNRNIRKTVVVIGGSGNQDFESGNGLSVGIPPFAQRAWVIRNPLGTTPLQVRFDAMNFALTNGSYTLPAGEIGPIFVPPIASELFFRNNSGVTIDGMQVVYELGL